MAQAELAANWPRSDVKADLAVNANEIPSQHGAAADKYYQLLSLHGDTVSNVLCKLETQPPGTKYRKVQRLFRLHVAERSQSCCSLPAQETCDAVSALPGCGTSKLVYSSTHFKSHAGCSRHFLTWRCHTGL